MALGVTACVLLAMAVAGCTASNVGDLAPPFDLPTLDGPVKSNYSSPVPAVFFLIDSANDLFSRAAAFNKSSIGAWAATSPPNAEFFFLTYDPNPSALMAALRALVHSAAGPAPLPRAHYVNESVGRLADTWIRELMGEQNWATTCSEAAFQTPNGDGFSGQRLDAQNQYTQYNFFPTNQTLPVRLLDCSELNNSSSSFAGHVALAFVPDCGTTGNATATALRLGASGLVLYDVPSAPPRALSCGDLCNGYPIASTMVDYTTGKTAERLLLADGALTVNFTSPACHGNAFCIDPQGKLCQVGWFRYPSLQFLAWEAVWLNYKYTHVDALLPTLTGPVVPIFDNVSMGPIDRGSVYRETTLVADVNQYLEAYLDLELSCPGTADADCPIWDRTVNMYVVNTTSGKEFEIGRWITPFRRRVGRWLSDISPISQLLAEACPQLTQCKFHLRTDPWVEAPWLVSASLRFSALGPNRAVQVVPIYQGVFTFNATYEKNFPPFTLSVPAGATQAALYTVITGHGSDENGCGEFCATSHVWTVNKRFTFVENFTLPNTDPARGCTTTVADGSIPNEHGTWMYGRDGWCDGNQVFPRIANLSSVVNFKQGEQVLITYEGFFNGSIPNPQQSPGYMIVASYVMFYSQ